MLTLALGTVFLLTQVREYSRVGFSPSDGAFGTIFYGLTGLHGAHVFVGLTLLTFATIRAFRGHFSPQHHAGVEIPGIYWHFVDVMWIVVYSTIYLLWSTPCGIPSRVRPTRSVWSSLRSGTSR